MQGLNAIISELRALQPDMQDLGISTLPGREYYRICRENERVSDLLFEAEMNGSIVAIKGKVTCIMPRLIEGWTQVKGGRRAI